MDLHARIARLERRNRLLCCLVGLAAVVPLGLQMTRLGAEEAKATPTEISERLVLRDANGTVAATLVAAPQGANLSLCDASGKPRMVFAVGKDGPSLVLLDNNQAAANRGVRVALSATSAAGSSLSLFGENSTIPLASVRTKPASGSTPATGSVVAVNDQNKPIAFPRSGSELEAAATP